MPNPICSVASLNSPCLGGDVLRGNDPLALKIYFMAAELVGNGGTNYLTATPKLTTPGAGGLLDASVQMSNKASLDDLAQFELAIFQSNAVYSGGLAAATPIKTLMQDINCLRNMNADALQRMYLFLLCQLGAHKAYPQ